MVNDYLNIESTYSNHSTISIYNDLLDSPKPEPEL
jgi:hypothetical protein